MTAQRALVTGAGGFVGANLVRRLLADGHHVVATLRPGGSNWRLESLAREVELVELDLRDTNAVGTAVRQARPNWIFHLAAYGAYSWETDRGRMVATNYQATVGLLTAAVELDFEAFVNTGSSSEYGFADHAPAETELPQPNSDYAATKAAATLFAGHVARDSGRRVATLRLYSAYGPWEDPGRLVPTLAARGLCGELPQLVAPTIARDFVHVDDVCEAFLLAANRAEPGGIYNIGSGVQTTICELVEIASRELELDCEPRWGTMDERDWDTSVWVANTRESERTLGWTPRVALDVGFRQMVAWLRERPELWVRYGVESADPQAAASARSAPSSGAPAQPRPDPGPPPD